MVNKLKSKRGNKISLFFFCQRNQRNSLYDLLLLKQQLQQPAIIASENENGKNRFFFFFYQIGSEAVQRGHTHTFFHVFFSLATQIQTYLIKEI